MLAEALRSILRFILLRATCQVHAALIVVLTRGGSTARLVAKYRPNIPVLTVAVPVLTTDSLTWTCSGVTRRVSYSADIRRDWSTC